MGNEKDQGMTMRVRGLEGQVIGEEVMMQRPGTARIVCLCVY